jgi:ankyrin repeat protein
MLKRFGTTTSKRSFTSPFGSTKPIARRLVELGVDINAKDSAGSTAIHKAVRFGNRGCTELLLEHGADLSIVDNNTDTPLETAISCGFIDLAKMLVDHGAKLDIFTASALGRVDEVQKFLDQKSAQTTEPPDSTWQPDRRWYSFAHATDPVPKGRFSPFVWVTPLHCAVSGGSVEAASFLVSRGAPISALDGQGKTPLFWAVEKGRSETAKFLIAHGADVNGTNAFGSTPLLTAARDTVSPELMKLLIKAGANVRITDGQGENALHKLAWYGYPPKNVETAQLLLDAGADITAKNKEGKTPLDILLDNSFQNPDLVKLYRKYSEQASSGSRK